jgi:hypothetical protein
MLVRICREARRNVHRSFGAELPLTFHRAKSTEDTKKIHTSAKPPSKDDPEHHPIGQLTVSFNQPEQVVSELLILSVRSFSKST